jgi:hypothetical protein
MKSYIIMFQILALVGRNAQANRWLRAPTKVATSEKKRMRYLRVDAAPRPMSTTDEGGWEEEKKDEVMMELDQIGNLGAFEDEPGSSLMDAFVIEQVQDSTDEEQLVYNLGR